MKPILTWLDRTTMYRVVLYVLRAWALYAVLLSLLGQLYYSPFMLAVSFGAVLFGAVGTHYVFKELWGATAANIESTLITVLILFFILEPSSALTDLVGAMFVAMITIASKYVLARHHVHLFNPAAFGLVVGSATALGFATWWIGNSLFLLPVLIGGALITEKIRRWQLVLTTIGTALLGYLVVQGVGGTLSLASLSAYLLGWPMYFFATVMVTEPLATPPGHRLQRWYGAMIGVLSALPFSFGFIASSYSLSLLIANLVFYPTTLRGRYTLKLESVREIARDTYEFAFTSPVRLPYRAGQYLEWTLPHARSDQRGIRRYFTIASAPTESHVLLGLKIPPANASSYKQLLSTYTPGDTISVTALGGDFTLPADPAAQPIVMIAGGIGVTPFRSQVAALMDAGAPVQATLCYFVNHEDELAWEPLWREAAAIGLRYVPVVGEPGDGWTGVRGRLSREVLSTTCPDISAARIYISGPPGMVNAARSVLKEMGVSERNIVVDYFPGLA